MNITPGKWKNDGNGLVVAVQADGRQIRVCQCYATDGMRVLDHEVTNGNATLISAAPELLSEIDDFLEQTSQGTKPLHALAYDRLREMIAKAKGIES